MLKELLNINKYDIIVIPESAIRSKYSLLLADIIQFILKDGKCIIMSDIHDELGARFMRSFGYEIDIKGKNIKEKIEKIRKELNCPVDISKCPLFQKISDHRDKEIKSCNKSDYLKLFFHAIDSYSGSVEPFEAVARVMFDDENSLPFNAYFCIKNSRGALQKLLLRMCDGKQENDQKKKEEHHMHFFTLYSCDLTPKRFVTEYLDIIKDNKEGCEEKSSSKSYYLFSCFPYEKLKDFLLNPRSPANEGCNEYPLNDNEWQIVCTRKLGLRIDSKDRDEKFLMKFVVLPPKIIEKNIDLEGTIRERLKDFINEADSEEWCNRDYLCPLAAYRRLSSGPKAGTTDQSSDETKHNNRIEIEINYVREWHCGEYALLEVYGRAKIPKKEKEKRQGK